MLGELKKEIARLTAAAAAIRVELDLSNDYLVRPYLLASLVVVLETKDAVIAKKVKYLKTEIAGTEMSSRLAAIETALVINKFRCHRR
jgi:hypothetical protein